MIEAVLLFGLLNIAFEFVLLCMLKPRTRCRLLGSPGMCTVVHITMLALNLAIHWGTLVGSMSAILAFCSSLFTVHFSRALFGSVQERVYRPGFVRYQVEELR